MHETYVENVWTAGISVAQWAGWINLVMSSTAGRYAIAGLIAGILISRV